MQPLVSIITPCFNGASFIKRYWDSVMIQSYPNIEVFFIDDGSKDSTKPIALSYKNEFEKKYGIGRFHYIYQENAGQAAAINRALPLVNGEYITWPDSDDWMTADCIEKKVDYLETHKEKGFVLCTTAVVNECDINTVVDIMKRGNTSKEMIFEDLLFHNDVYFAPGGYMVRASMFFEMLPSKHIFEGQCGQNWQMLLPIAYKYPCGFMDDILYYYLVRSTSHSHSVDTLMKNYQNAYYQYETLSYTLSTINMTESDSKKYLSQLTEKYANRGFSLAYQMSNPELMRKEYIKLKSLSLVGEDQKNAFLEICHPHRYKIRQILRNPNIIVERIVRK